MRATEFTVGRRFAVALDPGDEVLEALTKLCAQHDIRQATIPVFSGAFRSARLIAAHTPVDDRATWRALAARFEQFGWVLHHHHTGEDTGLWPLLRQRSSTDEIAVLDAMEAEQMSTSAHWLAIWPTRFILLLGLLGLLLQTFAQLWRAVTVATFVPDEDDEVAAVMEAIDEEAEAKR